MMFFEICLIFFQSASIFFEMPTIVTFVKIVTTVKLSTIPNVFIIVDIYCIVFSSSQFTSFYCLDFHIELISNNQLFWLKTIWYGHLVLSFEFVYRQLFIDTECTGAYLIFVIFFTQAKFLENKIYTEKTRKLWQNTQ